MRIGFVIMQIGNEKLDQIYYDAIAPALEENDITPRRVDKHNEGGLLKSEIITFIQESDVIVADLTNERPNCYLEVGYAMGIDKFRNLILTACEDHLLDSPNHKPGGPKIHFDLAGYDILFWHPDSISQFKDDLTKRIARRLAIIVPSEETKVSVWNDDWIQVNREQALAGLADVGLSGFMEVRYALIDQKINATQKELLEAATSAQIETFGWPLGVVLPNPDMKPRPTAEGIVTKVSISNQKFFTRIRNSFDYWSLNKNGDFYLLKSLFEDNSERGVGKYLLFNTRIVRITEALLHCARLYSNLQLDPTHQVAISIRHGGLSDRMLGASSFTRDLTFKPSTVESQIENEVIVSLSSIEANLVEYVKEFAGPIFSLFDYQEFADKVYEDIVQNFVNGKVV
jgi:hypothetical protein